MSQNPSQTILADSGERGPKGGLWAPALAVVMVASAPWLLLLVCGISPLTLASEAIGYRYFQPYRIQMREAQIVFLPQGQTLGLFHHLVVLGNRLLLAGVPPPLHWWFFDFSFGTYCLLSVLLFRALQLAGKAWGNLAFSAALLLFLVYGTRSGIFYIVDPDYYAFELAATMWVLGLAGNWASSPPAGYGRAIVYAGVLAGLMAGLKFTLAATSLLLLPPLLFAPGRRLGAKLRGLVGFGATAAAVFLLVLLLYYWGNWARLPVHFRMLASYVKQAGGEARFWPSLFFPDSLAANPGADYGYARFALAIWAASLIVAGLCLVHRWSPRLAAGVGAGGLLGFMHGWGLLTRPAASTLWEASACLLATAGTLLALMPAGRLKAFVRVGSISLLGVVAAVHGPSRFHVILPVATLRQSSRAIWESHQALLSAPPPRVFLIPNNDHTIGTVEETLMKGAVDFPTWAITQGRHVLDAMGEDITVVEDPHLIPSDASVLQVELLDQDTANLRAGRTFKKWTVDLYPWWRRNIVVYVPSAAPQNPASSR